MTGDRVAIFCPSLRAAGAERAMLNLAIGFADQGLRVDLVLAAATGPLVAEVPKAVHLVDLRARRVLTCLPALVRYLRSERPYAMVSALDYANVVALWARRLAGVPVRLVVSERNTMSQSTQRTDSRRERFLPLLARLFYPWADAVVAVSQGVGEDLIRITGLPAGKVHVIYNPTVGPDLLTKAQAPLQDPWFAPGEPQVVLAVGRLTRQKDLVTLIRAFALLRRRRPARLLILGEGEDRAALEALVRQAGLADDVRLPGAVTNPYSYMARAAVFALSSAWEGLPNALIEALALGTPVVSTDCPSGPREILENGRWGRLVPVGAVEMLAGALSDAMDSPRRGESSEAVRRFTRAESARQYLALLTA